MTKEEKKKRTKLQPCVLSFDTRPLHNKRKMLRICQPAARRIFFSFLLISETKEKPQVSSENNSHPFPRQSSGVYFELPLSSDTPVTGNTGVDLPAFYFLWNYSRMARSLPLERMWCTFIHCNTIMLLLAPSGILCESGFLGGLFGDYFFLSFFFFYENNDLKVLISASSNVNNWILASETGPVWLPRSAFLIFNDSADERGRTTLKPCQISWRETKFQTPITHN